MNDTFAASLNGHARQAEQFDNVISRLDGVKPSGSNGRSVVARCPAHDDRHQSLRVSHGDKGGVVLHCHAGCETEAVLRAIGLTLADVLPPKDRPPLTGSYEEIAYGYTDETGDILYYEAVRKQYANGKEFFQRKPDPDASDGWSYKLGDVRRVPYRLPDLAHPDWQKEWVAIVEGEKDVDRLDEEGWIATCNVGGAGKWREEYADFLRDRRVCIIPDHDRPGFQHALQVYRSLDGVAREIAIVHLLGVPEKGDVSDWMDAGGDMDAIDAALGDPTAPRQGFALIDLRALKRLAGEDDRAVIDATRHELGRLTDESWAAVARHNDPPRLFVFADAAVRVQTDRKGRLVPHELSDNGLRHELDRAARFEKFVVSAGECKPVFPPKEVVQNMRECADFPLPTLARVVGVPVFGPNGELLTNPGYHAPSETYYAPPPGFALPGSVPANPTAADVGDALALFGEMVADFPFVSEAERANALALFLLPFARAMIAGPTPLHLFESPKQGTGKSLLMESLLRPAVGDGFSLVAPPPDEAEWGKILVAELMTNPVAICLDNLTGRLDSRNLTIALTAPAYKGRELGVSRNPMLPIACAWAASGNNVTLGLDYVRRTIRIRLDSRLERPWERAGFRHDNLRAWIAEHRGDLAWSALTLVQAWVAKGRPGGSATLGGYEAWAATVGGILDAVGVPGFLGNLEAFYAAADTNTPAWTELFATWRMKNGDAEFRARDLYPFAETVDGVLGEGTERSLKVRFGLDLLDRKDQPFGPYRLVPSGASGNANRWRLELVDPRANPTAADPS